MRSNPMTTNGNNPYMRERKPLSEMTEVEKNKMRARGWRLISEGDCYTCGNKHPKAMWGVCDFARIHMMEALALREEMLHRRAMQDKRRRIRHEVLANWIHNHMSMVDSARDWYYWYVIAPDKRHEIEKVQGGQSWRTPSLLVGAEALATEV